jgi:hypothetical protein
VQRSKGEVRQSFTKEFLRGNEGSPGCSQVIDSLQSMILFHHSYAFVVATSGSKPAPRKNPLTQSPDTTTCNLRGFAGNRIQDRENPVHVLYDEFP